MREHDALGLSGGAGGVDDGAELAGQYLRCAHAIGSDFRITGRSDQRFVAQAIGGNVTLRIRGDHVFELRKLRAALHEFMQLLGPTDDDHVRAGMFQDVGHAVRRFIEIDGDGDAATANDGEIRSVPLGAIGGEYADAVTWLHAKLDEGHGETGHATQQLRGRDGFPTTVGMAEHLRARVRARVDGIEKSRGKRAVVHTVRSLYPTEFGLAMRTRLSVFHRRSSTTSGH